MPTIEEYMEALQEADARAQAGDREAAEDARKLADIIQSRKALQPKVGQMEDIGRGIGAGAKQGVEGIIGGGEDMSQLGGSLAGRLAGYLGADPDTVKKIDTGTNRALTGVMSGPLAVGSKALKDMGGPDLTPYFSASSAQVKEAGEGIAPILKNVNYDPQTTLGKYAKTGTEFGVGALTPGGKGSMLRKVAENVGTGLLSEAAGQATEGSEFEPLARLATGVGGAGLMSSFGGKRGNVTPAAQRQMDKGNVLTAGQAINNPTLMKIESELGGGTTQALLGRQADNFTAQAMAELGAPPGTAAHPDNMVAQHGRITGALDAAENAAGDVPISPQHQQRMLDAIQAYNSVVGPNNRAPVLNEVVRDVGALMRQNGGANLNGQQIAALRTRIREAAKAGDGQTAGALRQIQDAIDDATSTHLATANPGLAEQWGTARKQYRLYLDMEEAMANTPMASFAEGQVTPSALRGGVRGVEGNRRLVQGGSEYTDLAKEGAAAMPKVPDSGTAGRTRAMAGGAAAVSGNPGAALAILGGVPLLGSALMSKPVQGYLMSKGDDARAALTALIAAQDAKRRGEGRR